MTLWTMIFLIVLVGCVSNILVERQKTLRKSGSAGLNEADRRALEEERNRARAEIADLRERVKVLERIATDGNTLGASDTRRIAAEIDALRDQPDR